MGGKCKAVLRVNGAIGATDSPAPWQGKA